MTERNPNAQNPKIKSLELNAETLQDLTESEADQAQGGAINTGLCSQNCASRAPCITVAPYDRRC